MGLIKFAIVGSLGFCIDALCFVNFSLVVSAELARVLSFWVAASSNWFFNKHWTFDHENKAGSLLDLVSQNKTGFRLTMFEWAKFMAASVVSFLPNMGCYLLLIRVQPVMIEYPVLSLIPGVLVGMVSNYLFSKYWVFKNKHV